MVRTRKRGSESDPTRQIDRLREYLATLSTESLCRYMENLRMVSDGALVADKLGLQSPYREISYAMALAATTQEPSHPVELDGERLATLLEAVHDKYTDRYDFARGDVDRDKLSVAFGAFAKRFFAGPFMSVPQVIARVHAYLVPFDRELERVSGLSATAALRVADAIRAIAQRELDHINSLYANAKSAILSPSGRAIELRKAEQAFAVSTSEIKIKDLLADLGGDMLGRYLEIFGLKRGESADFFWFDDPNPYAERPIVVLNEQRVCVPGVNQVFLAIWSWGVRTLMASSARERFLRHRGRQLERDAAMALRKMMPTADVILSVYEAPGSDEHDLLAMVGDVAVVLEAKAGRPPPAMRDVEKTFQFVDQQFSSDSGIQKGYDQGNHLAHRLTHEPGPVTLYDESGDMVRVIPPGTIRKAHVVVVTLEEYGMLATDLSLLLQKTEAQPFPWAVNIYDLELFADVFVEKRGWGADEFVRWLDERQEAARRHSFATDDELEIAGVFVTHGSLDAFPKNTTVLGLREYSNVFEDFSHEKLGDVPVELREPTPADLGNMVEISPEEKAKIFAELARRSGVGRNDLCPCGSGKKYKKCHLR